MSSNPTLKVNTENRRWLSHQPVLVRSFFILLAMSYQFLCIVFFNLKGPFSINLCYCCPIFSSLVNYCLYCVLLDTLRVWLPRQDGILGSQEWKKIFNSILNRYLTYPQLTELNASVLFHFSGTFLTFLKIYFVNIIQNYVITFFQHIFLSLKTRCTYFVFN